MNTVMGNIAEKGLILILFDKWILVIFPALKKFSGIIFRRSKTLNPILFK